MIIGDIGKMEERIVLTAFISSITGGLFGYILGWIDCRREYRKAMELD